MPSSVEQSKVQWRNIQLDHLSRIILDENGYPKFNDDGTIRKWADIAYNIGIGYRCILDGRGLFYQGGGTGWPWDEYSISICILGNMSLEPVNLDLQETIIVALREIRRQFGNDLEPEGDRDVNSTNCPGDNFYPMIEDLWERSAAPTPIPDEDEDMGKPLYRVRSTDEYEAWLVRWDNGKLTHLSPAENGSPFYEDLPAYIELDRDSYLRLLKESGTTWQPSK
jgi:hypothetical protein